MTIPGSQGSSGAPATQTEHEASGLRSLPNRSEPQRSPQVVNRPGEVRPLGAHAQKQFRAAVTEAGGRKAGYHPKRKVKKSNRDSEICVVPALLIEKPHRVEASSSIYTLVRGPNGSQVGAAPGGAGRGIVPTGTDSPPTHLVEQHRRERRARALIDRWWLVMRFT